MPIYAVARRWHWPAFLHIVQTYTCHEVAMSMISRSRARVHAGALLSVALVLVLSACGDDPSSPADGTRGSVQVINAATTAIDVRIDGTLALSNIAVGTVSAALPVAVGAHVVQLTPSGTTTGGASVTIDAATALRRTVAATRATAGVNAVALADTGLLVGAGRSKLRVLHLAGNAPPLDIWRTQPDYQTPISILFPYTYLSGATVESSAGTWEVRVWPTGSGSWSAASSALTVTMTSGQLRTVVTLDVPGGGVKLQLLDP